MSSDVRRTPTDIQIVFARPIHYIDNIALHDVEQLHHARRNVDTPGLMKYDVGFASVSQYALHVACRIDSMSRRARFCIT